MQDFDLLRTTGLSPQELSDVLQANPRAYMAVRGAVAEKHLEKILTAALAQGLISNFRSASGDMDKDFYITTHSGTFSLECKNVEVIKTTTKSQRIDYINYLVDCSVVEPIANLENLSSAQLKEVFNSLPQRVRESGMTKYLYSASRITTAELGLIPDQEFIHQFDDTPLSIDFQRTRNSTDSDGNTKRNRLYREGEIDAVGACLFSRTTGWQFLYAPAQVFAKHTTYTERYRNNLVLNPRDWTSSLGELITNLS